MGYQEGQIRVLALGLVRQGDRLFLSEGYNQTGGQTFYRALGGGVDFGEHSAVALKREFQEELQAEIANLRYLGCIESIFVYNDRPGHELIQLYECDFVDPEFYQRSEVMFSEGDRQKKALWVDLHRFASGELRLVPEQCWDFLQASL